MQMAQPSASPEIGNAFVEIDEPFFDPAHNLLLMKDGVRWAGFDTDLTVRTEVFCADIFGRVRHQRHIRGDSGEAK